MSTSHQMNEQCHMFANTIFYTIQVDLHAQFVPGIQTGVKWRAVICCAYSTDGTLATISELFYSPGLCSITKTSCLLPQPIILIRRRKVVAVHKEKKSQVKVTVLNSRYM